MLNGNFTLLNDIKISFTDSGAPPNADDYPTLIILHGGGFGAASFQPIQSLAPEANLRIVALTRRGYTGSTPYTDSEMQGFQEGTREALEGLAVVLVAFMKAFVEKEKIPSSGGIAIMGWSIGNLTTMSLFSNPDGLDPDTKSFLEVHLKHIILYDPPYQALGLDLHPSFHTSRVYSPWTDTSMPTLDDKISKFFYWASSSFEHNPIATLSTTSPDGYDFRQRANPGKCLVDSWSEEDKKKYWEASGVPSDVITFGPEFAALLRQCTSKALFSDSRFLPNLRFTYLYTTRGPWMTVYAYLEVKRLYEEYLRGENASLDMEFVGIEDVGHCAHQESSQRFVEVLRKALARQV
ncbi:hypothetical protein VNI00_008864 [Paramarasmius palmivorus]|uniref:AB hydrolase-1 domain-containing protein n=1 Tax=Paramarasmius palmivorus TaxID=297713 RepID=A0AAW0CP93_9AGAR